MSMHNEACFVNHMGVWMVEPEWFGATVSAILAGQIQPRDVVAISGSNSDDEETRVVDGVAVIPISGPMMKREGKYAAGSTIRVRRAIRRANDAEDVRSILLHIESPGGHANGTFELASEIDAADKPVEAFIEDLGASAAYWAASRTDRISANAPALIGSIGTYSVVYDLSGAAAMQGVKVHLISSGDLKGAGVEGTEITPEYLAYRQRLVDDLNGRFLNAVAEGRNVSLETVEQWATGEVFPSEQALDMGLIDEISTIDAVITRMAAEHKTHGASDGSQTLLQSLRSGRASG